MVEEQELQDTSKDARIAIVGEAVYLIIGYAITLLIAREAGPRALGIYALSLVFVKIGGICCTMGLKQASLRYIPLYLGLGQAGLVRGIVVFASRISGLLGAVMGAALLGLSSILAGHLFKEPVLSDALRIVAIALPLFALQGVWSYALQGFKAIKYKVFVEKILEPGTRLVAVGLFFLFGIKLLGSVLAILVGVLGSTIVAFHFLKALLASIPEEGQTKYQPRPWLFYSVPLLFQNLAVFLQPSIPLLLIGYFEDSSQVGVFSAALKVSTLISLPLVGLNTVFAPRISELYAGSGVEKLKSLYRTMTAWTISVSLLPFLITLLFAAPIMRIFGPEFEANSSILSLLAVGSLMSAASGSAGCILVMTGRVNISLANALLGTLLGLLLNLFLIPSLGIRGAAIASTAILVSVSILGLIEVFYLLGIQPYGRDSLKPLIPGGIATIGLLLLSGQGTKFYQILLFAPAYLGLFWLLNSTDEKDWLRNRPALVIQEITRLLRSG